MSKLYDKQLKAVLGKEHSKVFEMSDGNGLSVRVSPKGKVRWQMRYKVDNKNKRLDLGDYPDLSIQKAREAARQCREWLAEGVDPKHQRNLEREQSLKPISVKDALDYWLKEYAKENRVNYGKHKAQFHRHIYPYIGDLPLEKAGTHHWLECFDRIRKGIAGKQKPAPVAAGYVLQHAKQALRFCRVRRYATSTALDDLLTNDVGRKQQKRDRILSNTELVDLWKEVEGGKLLAPYYRNLFKLLIVFGARTQEVRLSTWNEWNFEEMLWSIPKEHSKTGDKIVRPIPHELLPWLKSLRGVSHPSEFILDEIKNPETVSQQGRVFWKRLKHEEAWTLHDLRRTFATRLNELGVAPYVVEQLLGHSLGGVMAIYNRSQYLPEKQQALSVWIEYLNMIANKPTNVVPITQYASSRE